MTIDERALQAAMDAYCAFHDPEGEWNLRDSFRCAIEAYEAAKADPWVTMEEAKTIRNRDIVVCLTDCRNEMYTAFYEPEGNHWKFDGGEDFFWISHEDVIERGLMARTIDPPSQKFVVVKCEFGDGI